MACPYFIPFKPAPEIQWPHPARLPLSDGYRGQCGAPGHESAVPGDDDLQHRCNLGYARGCVRLPEQRPADAVRFAVALDGETRLQVAYVLECAHAPAGHGWLEYDRAQSRFIAPHADARLQRQAECFVRSWLARRPPSDPPAHESSNLS